MTSKTALFCLLLAGTIFSEKNQAQTTTIDFEELSLNAQSFYQDNSGTDFSSHGLSFQYDWNTTWNYWSGGFAYSNINDSVTSGATNLYATKAFKGYNNSANYVCGQNGARIKFTGNLLNKTVNGLMICNSTYAANSMRNGDAFAKKFGGVSGNDPDWFKLTIKGYTGGVLGTDSVDFYLADYRFSNNAQDYIVKDWTFVNLLNLGMVDSLTFKLSSSDVGNWGMNTPAFFCLDNILINATIGMEPNNASVFQSHFFPNPNSGSVTLTINEAGTESIDISIIDICGRQVYEHKTETEKGKLLMNLNLEQLSAGVYFLNIKSGAIEHVEKLIRQ